MLTRIASCGFLLRRKHRKLPLLKKKGLQLLLVFGLEDPELAGHIVDDHDDHVGQDLDDHAVQMHFLSKDEHDRHVQQGSPDSGRKEAGDFVDVFLKCSSLAVENPLAVGQVGKDNRQELSHDRARHDGPLKEVVAQPVGGDIDQSGHNAPEDVRNDVFVLFP